MKASVLIWVLCTLIATAVSCKKTDHIESAEVGTQPFICEVKNPIDNLTWLKQLKDTLVTDKRDLGLSVYTVPYKGTNIIWIYSGFYNYYPMLFNCDGQRVYLPDNLTVDSDAVKLLNLLASEEVCKFRIWSSPASAKRCQ